MNYIDTGLLIFVFRAFNGCFADLKVKYTNSAMPFKQMENIATFLHALSKLPTFRSFDLFSTVDLYEGKNMAQVVRCILACKRLAEKEALSRGIQNLNINTNVKENEVVVDDVKMKEEDYKIEQETEPEQMQEMAEEQESVESQPQEQQREEQQDDENDAQETPFEEIIEPEIVLIDSPVYADDESVSISNDKVQPDEEEYETFTVENPGTFEIQLSN